MVDEAMIIEALMKTPEWVLLEGNLNGLVYYKIKTKSDLTNLIRYMTLLTSKEADEAGKAAMQPNIVNKVAFRFNGQFYYLEVAAIFNITGDHHRIDVDLYRYLVDKVNTLTSLTSWEEAKRSIGVRQPITDLEKMFEDNSDVNYNSTFKGKSIMNNDIPSVNIVMPRIEKLTDNDENLYYHVVNNKEDLVNLFKYVSAMMASNPSSLLNFHIPFSVRGKLFKIDGVMYEVEGVYKTNLDVLRYTLPDTSGLMGWGNVGCYTPPKPKEKMGEYKSSDEIWESIGDIKVGYRYDVASGLFTPVYPADENIPVTTVMEAFIDLIAAKLGLGLKVNV